MPKGTTRQFWIDSFTPKTIPMERLAQYMQEFAKLLGESEHVHFIDVIDGSALLISYVDDIAVPKVSERLESVRRGTGPAEAHKAFDALDRMLAADNAVGELRDECGAKIIAFPGRTKPRPLKFGPFREDGSLEGVVIKLGGKDTTVPVHIQESSDRIHKCNATVEMSKRLSPYYREGFLRVHGSGRWMREETGVWTLVRFDIKDFEVLDERPLRDVLGDLQDIEGTEWGDDPVGDLMRLRQVEAIQ